MLNAGMISLAAHHAEVVQVELLPLQLLLKQGVKDDGRGARLLQPLELGQIFAEGRGGAHHQGAAQGKAKPGGPQIRLGHRVPGLGRRGGTPIVGGWAAVGSGWEPAGGWSPAGRQPFCVSLGAERTQARITDAGWSTA